MTNLKPRSSEIGSREITTPSIAIEGQFWSSMIILLASILLTPIILFITLKSKKAEFRIIAKIIFCFLRNVKCTKDLGSANYPIHWRTNFMVDIR